MSLTNNSGNRGVSLISRRLLTADEIKQLHYKTIIFPVNSYPIFRKTIVYKKFSCYKKGFIEREVRPLDRLIDTYYTMEQIRNSNQYDNQEPKLNTIESQKKTKLVSIINNVIKIFGKIDFNVEYIKDEDNIIAQLYLAPPLSTNDIKGLEELSMSLDFGYNAISDKEKIDRKNRNSLIEIFLIEREKEM